MSNKYFKNELIKRTENVSELQKLGRIHTGFNSMVNSMVCEVLQMLELKSFPYGELFSIKSTYYTIVSVLISLSVNMNTNDQNEILDYINMINKNFTLKNRNNLENRYRSKEDDVYKYGNPMKIVDSCNIEKAMQNLSKDIICLIKKKDEMSIENYVKETMRLHYRFLRISPYEYANGRTARALVNAILKEKDVLAIFRKESRKDYFNFINEINKSIETCESEYLLSLVNSTDLSYKFEDEKIDFDFPMILIKL